jgi:ketosteroid isomerase-like protein
VSQSNAEIISSGYEAFAAGDIPAVLAVFAEDITWKIAGRSPLAGTYTGHDEVLGFFQNLGERSGGTFHLDIQDVLDNGEDRVVLVVTETAQREDRSLSHTAVHMWSVRDGKATSFQGISEDDYENDAFWS